MMAMIEDWVKLRGEYRWKDVDVCKNRMRERDKKYCS